MSLPAQLCRLGVTETFLVSSYVCVTFVLSALTSPVVTFSIPAATSAVIVLAQLDTRYFRDIAGTTKWSFDFVLFKKGKDEPISYSNQTSIYHRSVNLERFLEAGDYIVHVSLLISVL